MHSPHCSGVVVTQAAIALVEPAVVVTRHGKYKDPEARKEYQRRKMREVRAAKKAPLTPV